MIVAEHFGLQVLRNTARAAIYQPGTDRDR
jgi:hypothetical protein